MIIPDNLTLEELIGAYKANIATLETEEDDVRIELYEILGILEVVKRELDKKQDVDTLRPHPEYVMVSNEEIERVANDLMMKQSKVFQKQKGKEYFRNAAISVISQRLLPKIAVIDGENK